MKIIKYGEVILAATGPRVEGWHVEREPEDPADATMEQLLLAFAIDWAKKIFDEAVRCETMRTIRAMAHNQQKTKVN